MPTCIVLLGWAVLGRVFFRSWRQEFPAAAPPASSFVTPRNFLHSGRSRTSMLREISAAPTDDQHVAEGDYQTAYLIREVENRLLRLFSEGKLNGTVHTCIGQEWTGVAIARHLVPGDQLCSNHRGHGHFLAVTGDVTGLIAEVMGRSSGVVAGRGGSQHLCAEGFLSKGI